MSAGFSTPTTSTMVNSRRATASCTHKTWVWRCLTRPTPRLEAIAFDAVASTRTRGFTTFAMSAAGGHRAQSSRCSLGQCAKLRFTPSLSPPHFESLPTLQGGAHHAVRGWYLPGGNTPHWAKAQGLIPSTTLTLKKKCRSEYR